MNVFFKMLIFALSLSTLRGAESLDLSCRQTFLDDTLVARSSGTTKVYHQAVTLPQRVVACDTAVEKQRNWIDIPSVIRDGKTGKFRMWYTAMIRPVGDGPPKRMYSLVTMYAESDDGLQWTKPQFNAVESEGDKGANNILNAAWLRTVLPNPHGPGCVAWEGKPYRWYILDDSGKVTERVELEKIINNDTITGLPETRRIVPKFISDETRLGWDPVTQTFIATIKTGAQVKESTLPDRVRRATTIATSPDGRDWQFSGSIVTSDSEDDAYLRTQSYVDAVRPAWTELDNMPVFRYENVLIGLMTLMYMYNGDDGGLNSEIFLTWSTNGTTWQRPHPRQAFIAAPESAPNFGFFKAGVTPPIRVGDELWFYHGWGGRSINGNNKVLDPEGKGIGLSRLRLDGFASLRAGAEEAVVETKSFAMPGKTLRVNGDFSQGSCIVEWVGTDRTVTSKPLSGDGVALAVEWTDSAPTGQGFLRFRFRQGDLYSFYTL